MAYYTVNEKRKREAEEELDVTYRDDFGRTLLHDAVRTGTIKDMDDLVKAGADVDAVDKSGWSIAHRAAYLGNLEAIRFLKKHGARMDVVWNGLKPIDEARQNGHDDVVEELSR